MHSHLSQPATATERFLDEDGYVGMMESNRLVPSPEELELVGKAVEQYAGKASVEILQYRAFDALNRLLSKYKGITRRARFDNIKEEFPAVFAEYFGQQLRIFSEERLKAS